jgi:2-oxoglutarate dehydrogenase E2 component (dihydrolipoamide succinyltransferase)
MSDVTVPKLNSNDETFVLVEWLVEDGGRVRPGVPLAVVETSKASHDILAEEDGILRHVVSAGTEWQAGTVIARVGGSRSAAVVEPAAQPATGGYVLTASAEEAMLEYGLDQAELGMLGKRIVKRQDVEDLVQRRDAGPEVAPLGERRSRELSKLQRAVADQVTRSNRDIPTAFVAMKVFVDVLQRVLHDQVTKHAVALGPVEVMVKAVATLFGKFPDVFSSLRGGLTVEVDQTAHVGVTTDVGTGLYVPVVHDPASLSLVAVADVLMDHRIKALRGGFDARDLAGGNITISLHNDEDVVLAKPIVMPGQTAVVCLCGTQDELFRNEDGEIGQRCYTNLGLAYDHRLVNGRDAVLFMRELKAVLETKQALEALVG